MADRLVAEFRRSISDHRLERYRRPAAATDLAMLSNYFWNMAIADALLCSLGTVEILLRNTMHNTLSDFFGRGDWYDGPGLLEERQLAQRDQARRHIESRGKPVTPERMVSNLTFGFWVTLLSGNYNDRFWRPMRQRNLLLAFPYSPTRRRNDIQSKYYRANNLRNLAFHHEPLFDYPDLLDEYHRAYEAIEWINPAMVTSTKLFDRFPDVYANGRAEVETRLKGHLGL